MTRYDVYDFDHRLVPSPDGAWVRFEDVPQWSISTAPQDTKLIAAVLDVAAWQKVRKEIWRLADWEDFNATLEAFKARVVARHQEQS